MIKNKNIDILVILKNYRFIQFIFELYHIAKFKNIRIGFLNLSEENNNKKEFSKLLNKMNFKEFQNNNFKKFNVEKIIVTWGNYNLNEIKKIKKIKSKKKYLFCGLMNHSELYFKFLKNNYNFDRCIYLNKFLYDFRFKKLKNYEKLSTKKLIFGKIRFKKNNFLEETLYADYIIALPTPLSFSNKFSKIIFLKNTLKIINKVNKNSKIIIKYHNSKNDIIYFTDFKIYQYLFFIQKMINLNNCALTIYKFFKFKFLKNFYLNLRILDLLNKVISKCINLNKLTKYHFMNLEIFLPYIKSGLITGQSNSLWYGLTSPLKVYNCAVDNYAKPQFKNYDKKIHGEFMKFLDVKCCGGNLNFKNKKQKKNAVLINKQPYFLDLI
jgi:hypothetical protein